MTNDTYLSLGERYVAAWRIVYPDRPDPDLKQYGETWIYEGSHTNNRLTAAQFTLWVDQMEKDARKRAHEKAAP